MKDGKKCAMQDTRPGISVDENGACYACNNEKRKDSIDWSSRYKELEKL